MYQYIEKNHLLIMYLTSYDYYDQFYYIRCYCTVNALTHFKN